LLESAGFAHVYRETPLTADEMTQMRGLLQIILDRQLPYSAVAIDRHSTCLVGKELGAADDPAGQALLAEIRRYSPAPAIANAAPGRVHAHDLLLPIHIRKPDLDLRLFSTIMTLGTPYDVTLQELRIETFFPADAESERCWARLFTA
jgi:hypothetical protein